jgi:ParB family chromosome partitioning protein
MTVERPKGLVLNDIVIKRNEASAEAADKESMASEASAAASNKPKANLLAGLISDDAQGGNTDNYEMISVNLLDPFYDHPFKAYSEEDLSELVESVKLLGVVNPVIVRKKAGGRYEILSGHNRANAAKNAGLRTVPCKVVDADDDLAKLIVTDTNLKQRQKLSYSEKARAYKMQLDALKKQGKRRDLLDAIDQENNFGTSGPEVRNARDIVAEMNNTVGKQISRYIRLLKLNEELLKKVDSERIPFKAGVELSYLSDKMQDKINALLDTLESLKISVEAAETIRSMDEEELICLSGEDIIGILSGKVLASNTEEPKPKKFTPFKTAFKAAEKQFKKIDRYTVESIDEKELEKIVIDAVEDYLLKKRQ